MVAVKLVTTIHNYIGEAADTKPTDAAVPVGSTFKETDTLKEYVYDGTDWHETT